MEKFTGLFIIPTTRVDKHRIECRFDVDTGI